MNTSAEKIALLERFDAALEEWFVGKVAPSERDNLRKRLNEMSPQAQTFIREAKCNKIMTLTPPAAIGGPIARVDPFNMIFEDYFGMSLIPTVRDMTQQAIGVFRSGRLEEVRKEEPKEESIIYKELTPPEKVTLIWLVQHVPVSLWFVAAGLLLAAFTLGLKASHWSFVKEMLGSP